jgi:hypothetical protein
MRVIWRGRLSSRRENSRRMRRPSATAGSPRFGAKALSIDRIWSRVAPLARSTSSRLSPCRNTTSFSTSRSRLDSDRGAVVTFAARICTSIDENGAGDEPASAKPRPPPGSTPARLVRISSVCACRAGRFGVARLRTPSATCAWISSDDRKPPKRDGSAADKSLVLKDTSASARAGPGSGGGASAGLASCAMSFNGLNSGTSSSLPVGASARVVATCVKPRMRMICLSPAFTATGVLKLCFSATMSAERISRSPFTRPEPASLAPRAGVTSSGARAMVARPFIAKKAVVPINAEPATPVSSTAANQRNETLRRSGAKGGLPDTWIGGSRPTSAMPPPR